MKAKLFAIGLFLFALAACVQRAKAPEPVEGPSLELQSIDSLMWRQPDSALTRLLPWFDTCCRDAACHVSTATAYNRHYANLLLSELLYKNDYPQTNRRELQQAVAYFDSISQVPEPVEGPSNRIAFLDARAHYINGVGYYENESVVPACKEYMRALDVMEGRFKEKELVGKKAKFIAFTYTRLTEIFSDMYLHEQVIYFSKESLNYYDKYNVSSSHVAWILNAIGSNYDMMEQLDSADYYYKKAIHILGDTSTLMYRNIIAHQAYLKYKMDFHNANASISSLLNLLSETESVRETIIRYSYIGEILFHEKRFDSAWMYLNIVFQKAPDIGSKKQAAERLVEICKTQGREDEMLEYAGFLVPFATQDENNSVIKSQLTELYKAFNQSQHERQHEKERQRHRNRSMTVIAGLSLVTLIVLALYRNNKRRKQHLEKQIKEEKQTHSMEKKALSSRLKKSNETLRELQDQIKKQDRNPLKLETPADSFVDEPICRLILERVSAGQFKSKVDYLEYKTYALSKQQLIDLRVAVDQHFDKFTIRLKKAYPQLTNGDLDYCCLYLLGLTDADIAALMQRAYNTVVERDGKLKKVFGNENPLPVTLMGVARQSLSI